MQKLFETLRIEPKAQALYDEALTHPSVHQSAHYERLEFLGDAVIELITTDYIYRTFPQYAEGRMTKLRARTVSRPSLAQFAKEIDLGSYLRLSRAEQRGGGQTKDTTLCNALEALIGAVHLDLGYEVAARVFLSLAKTSLDRGYLENETEEENPKGRLQEVLQALAPISPVYQTLSAQGPDHRKTFRCRVLWQDKTLATGEGPSKKSAESEAARLALQARAWS